MALTPGTRLGVYEITAQIGEGGMGEVYKGRDTRLDRTVAIKVLHESLSSDPQFRVRFDREARAISQLTHPHVCTLYDIGEQAGTAFLVMEFLDGETLADRLSRGVSEKSAVPVDEVLRLAIQIADALATAHHKGIIHRDLKPGNVMLTKSGVKLLDFGLAKTSEAAVAANRLSELPTTPPQAMTTPGTILGTFQYMAPEQLESKEADPRTDIFAFGAVVYEMATGRRAFAGSSQASLITAIMSSQPPPLKTLQPVAPPALERIVCKCLEKDPERRWQTARDLADELRWISTTSDALAGNDNMGPRRAGAPWQWAVAAIFALAALALGYLLMQRPAATPPEAARFTLTLPSTSSRGVEARNEITTSLAVSPDGRNLALAADSDGRSRLWLRPLGETDFKVIPGTEGAFSPFWSPDSRFIGFGAEGKLKKVEVGGGSPRIICDAAFEGVATWNQFGTILFADDVASQRGIMSVSADGGTPQQVTVVDPLKGTVGHNWPQFLPDGRHFLFSVMELPVQKQDPRRPRLFLGSLDGAVPKLVADAASRVEYTASGHLVYVNDGTLLAQRFDLDNLRVLGEPTAIAEGVRVFKPTGNARFTASQTGVLAFETTINYSPRLVWFDRNGQVLDTLTMPGPIKSLRLSPDGQRLAVDVVDVRTGISDVWLQDVDRGGPKRFTYQETDEVNPIWSDGGKRIVFRSDREGPPDIHEKALEGAGNQEVVLALPGVQHPLDVSLDNQRLIYFEEDRITRADLWMLPLTGERKPLPLLRTPFEERDAVFSPDGRWIAFESDESGAPEIYVTPIDAVGSRRRVSLTGGQTPRWRRDGKELFYMAPNGGVMSVTITLAPVLQVAPARQLFVVADRAVNDVYDVSPDGQRFLVNTATERDPAPITVILNWTSALRR